MKRQAATTASAATSASAALAESAASDAPVASELEEPPRHFESLPFERMVDFFERYNLIFIQE